MILVCLLTHTMGSKAVSPGLRLVPDGLAPALAPRANREPMNGLPHSVSPPVVWRRIEARQRGDHDQERTHRGFQSGRQSPGFAFARPTGAGRPCAARLAGPERSRQADGRTLEECPCQHEGAATTSAGARRRAQPPPGLRRPGGLSVVRSRPYRHIAPKSFAGVGSAPRASTSGCKPRVHRFSCFPSILALAHAAARARAYPEANPQSRQETPCPRSSATSLVTIACSMRT